ncbi:MAG: hypothetical protein NXH88_16540 [Hyphomonas sp.]|nr:hypothetical protein [Hyphomonas sp.]
MDWPAGDLLANPAQGAEPAQIQAFVPKLAIETLDEVVLRRCTASDCLHSLTAGFARLDEPQTNAGPHGPAQYGAACAFQAVVEDDLLG